MFFGPFRNDRGLFYGWNVVGIVLKRYILFCLKNRQKKGGMLEVKGGWIEVQGPGINTGGTLRFYFANEKSFQRGGGYIYNS